MRPAAPERKKAEGSASDGNIHADDITLGRFALIQGCDPGARSMKRFGTALASATILTAVMSAQQPAPAPQLLSPGPAAARFPRNLDEFDQMFNQVKNWGRWGPDDQLGAANLITEATRKHALGLAKLGIVVSLAHPPLKEA